MTETDTPMTAGEVADLFAVTTTTVKRWAEDGLLPYFKTPGGHYRFDPDGVRALRASQESGRTNGSAA